MDFPSSDRILLYPRKVLRSPTIEQWPAPKNHRYYHLYLSHYQPLFQPDDEAHKEYILKVLDAARERPDIDSLEFFLRELRFNSVWDKMEALLNRNDRTWIVSVNLNSNDRVLGLPRVLRVFRNVQFLHFTNLTVHRLPNFVCLDDLPRFQNLRSLRFFLGMQDAMRLDRLVSYPFAPQLYWIRLWRRFGEGVPAPFLSKDTLSRIRSLNIDFSYLTVEFAANAVAALEEMTSLQCLYVNEPHHSQHQLEYTSVIASLFKWLGSTQCPITEIKFETPFMMFLPDLLVTIPNIPLLKSLWLSKATDSRGLSIAFFMEDLFAALMASKQVEWVKLQGWDSGCDFSHQDVLEFQLASRPRLFLVQLTQWHAEANPGPERYSFTDISKHA